MQRRYGFSSHSGTSQCGRSGMKLAPVNETKISLTFTMPLRNNLFYTDHTGCACPSAHSI
ncbi:hypothetical protein RvY_17313 [Ramazzottius varieornatus]|uniref:Uncharacterized protein n=1 Tax=Ramazzottius varieornatus TaxID=947166 RepID=A0A1D1W2I2_RAMVA|nr:hypothetical protein RvY_17313 [Ramazzottius varieornatus]